MADPFAGKTAIVTGASSGIGRAVALELARRGTKVALLARRLEQLEEVRDEIVRAGGAADAILCDVTDSECVKAAVSAAEARLGPTDILVLSAGIYVQGKAQDLEMEAIRRAMEINFYGTLSVLYAVLRGMLARRSGMIAVITSMDGCKALAGDGAYAATKFALNGFIEALRQDLRGTGVRTLTVMPGRIDTPMIAHIDVPAVSAKVPPERVARAIVSGIRRRRKEIIVPWLPNASLIAADTISPALGDWVIRTMKLTGSARKQGRPGG